MTSIRHVVLTLAAFILILSILSITSSTAHSENHESQDKLSPAIRSLILARNKRNLRSNPIVAITRQPASSSQRGARSLLLIKALALGPLIGLTIKAALIRGLIWAIGAYLIHLFFPGILSALGLGSGLVGFARQLQPDYAQMLVPHLSNLHNLLPQSVIKLAEQYRETFVPVMDALNSIPEGHCRFRAVCESASYLVKNANSMSATLQRFSSTVYLNFGTEYSKAWLDGIVLSDCAAKYSQCTVSPFSIVAGKLAAAVRPSTNL